MSPVATGCAVFWHSLHVDIDTHWNTAQKVGSWGKWHLIGKCGNSFLKGLTTKWTHVFSPNFMQICCWEMVLRRFSLPDKKFVSFYTGHFGRSWPMVPEVSREASRLSLHYCVNFHHPDQFRIAGVIHKKLFWTITIYAEAALSWLLHTNRRASNVM